jgi:hypothetical protein
MPTLLLRFAVILVLAFACSTSLTAQTCSSVLSGTVDGPLSWLPSSGLPMLFESTIDEWDSDVLKIRLRRAGLLVIGSKEIEVEATLFRQVNQSAQAVSTTSPLGPTTDKLSQWLDAGIYCLEIEADAAGTFELELQFFDGCDLKEVAEAEEYCDAV